MKMELTTDEIPMSQLATPKEGAKKYHKSYQSPIVANEENAIREQLNALNISLNERVEILTYHLANSQIRTRMLFLDRIIFSEQIKLLLFANEQVKSCGKSDFVIFFDEWKNKNPTESYTFNDFINFLTSQQLLSDSGNGYNITLLGKECLQFIIIIGKKIYN